MDITDQSLRKLAAQVGTGDHAAFRRLYTACAPTVLAAVCTHLPDHTQSMPVVRATFCEVWRICAFDLRCGTERQDIPAWITAIAHHRGAERHQTLRLMRRGGPPGQAAFWSAFLDSYDERTRFELARMLDTDEAPTEGGRDAEPASCLDASSQLPVRSVRRR
jgi:hypothetical protein